MMATAIALTGSLTEAKRDRRDDASNVQQEQQQEQQQQQQQLQGLPPQPQGQEALVLPEDPVQLWGEHHHRNCDHKNHQQHHNCKDHCHHRQCHHKQCRNHHHQQNCKTQTVIVWAPCTEKEPWITIGAPSSTQAVPVQSVAPN
ncbi:hypothetical protein DFQ26_009895, partial [Actinomortierella ambigua]